MSMWMTSGASRLKAKQGQSFAARAQQRSRVTASGRLLSSHNNRRILGRHSTSRRRKRIVVGETATLDDNRRMHVREGGIAVSVGVENEQLHQDTRRLPPYESREQYGHRVNAAGAEYTETPVQTRHEDHIGRSHPRQLHYGVAPQEAPYAFSPHSVNSRRLSQGHCRGARPQSAFAPTPRHYGIPVQQAIPQVPQGDHIYHRGLYETGPLPFRYAQRAPLETPLRQAPIEAYSPQWSGQRGREHALTPFQRYLKSPPPQLYETSFKSPAVSTHSLPGSMSAPLHPMHYHPVHPCPARGIRDPYVTGSSAARDPDEDFFKVTDSFSDGNRGQGAQENGGIFPLRTVGAFPRPGPPQDQVPVPPFSSHFTPANHKRSFESGGHSPDIRGSSFGRHDEWHDGFALQQQSDNQFLGGKMNDAPFRKKARPLDTIHHENSNTNVMRFSFGGDEHNGSVRQRTGGIAKFQKPRSSKSVSSPFKGTSGLSQRHLNKPEALFDSGEHPPDRHSGALPAPDRDRPPGHIRYFNDGLEVDMTGRPLDHPSGPPVSSEGV